MHSTTHKYFSPADRQKIESHLRRNGFQRARKAIQDIQSWYRRHTGSVQYWTKWAYHGIIVVRVPMAQHLTLRCWIESRAAFGPMEVMRRHRTLQTLGAVNRFIDYIDRTAFVARHRVTCKSCGHPVRIRGNQIKGYWFEHCSIKIPLDHGMPTELLATARPDRTRRAAHRRALAVGRAR